MFPIPSVTDLPSLHHREKHVVTSPPEVHFQDIGHIAAEERRNYSVQSIEYFKESS